MGLPRSIALLAILASSASWSPQTAPARTDPTAGFIASADSLLANGAKEALVTYVKDHSVLVGAGVAELLERAFTAWSAGDETAEKNLVRLAFEIAKAHRRSSGSSISYKLTATYLHWSPEERKLKKKARELEALALRARKAGELDRAIFLLQEALAAYVEIGDLHSQAVVYGSLGVVHWYRGDMEAVYSSYEKALEARRRVEDRILEGRTLNGLGSVNLRSGRYQEAAEYYRRAIDLRRRTGDLAGLGTSLTYLGNTYYMMNKLVDARRQFESALPLLERTGSPAQVLEALNSIAILYSELGRIAPANDSYRRAIAVAAQAGLREHEATIRLNLAANLRQLARYRDALDELERVEAILSPAPDLVKHVEFLRERGLTYLAMGETEQAKEDLLRCWRGAQKLATPFHRIEASINLGYLYKELGAYQQALAKAVEAKALAAESGQNRLVSEAAVLQAVVERYLGRHRQAIKHWNQIIAADSASGLEASEIKDKMSKAANLAEMGKAREARDIFQLLLPRVRRSGEAMLRCSLQLGLGHTFEKENADSACAHYEEALAVLEGERAGIGGAELTSTFFSGERRYFYEEVARFYATCARKGEGEAWTERAFAVIERAKARGLLDLLRGGLSAETSEAEEAVLDSIFQAKRQEDSDEVRRLERRYAELREERLRAKLGGRQEVGETARLKEVGRSIPKGTLMVEYALGDSASLCWVTDRNLHSLYFLPPRRELRRAVLRLRDALLSPGISDPVLRSASRSLFVRLMGPFAARTARADRLVIVPDGILFTLPFEVLLTAEPEEGASWKDQPFLGNSTPIVYAPSASVYMKLAGYDGSARWEGRRKAPGRWGWRTARRPHERGRAAPGRESRGKRGRSARDREACTIDLAAFGAPDFSTLANPASPTTELPPLPFAGEEVESIASLLDPDRVIVKTGAAASEAQLKDLLKNHQPRVLHLATHGLVDPVQPDLSRLVLSADQGRGEDGYLHTLEIMSLPMQIDLVVASACESGLGRLGRGEGVVGLARAFFAAGAKGAVVSLWRVSDRSTAVLMREFYRELLGKRRGVGEAMRRARLALMKTENYAHPFYWAPFVVVGTHRVPW